MPPPLYTTVPPYIMCPPFSLPVLEYCAPLYTTVPPFYYCAPLLCPLFTTVPPYCAPFLLLCPPTVPPFYYCAPLLCPPYYAPLYNVPPFSLQVLDYCAPLYNTVLPYCAPLYNVPPLFPAGAGVLCPPIYYCAPFLLLCPPIYYCAPFLLLCPPTVPPLYNVPPPPTPCRSWMCPATTSPAWATGPWRRARDCRNSCWGTTASAGWTPRPSSPKGRSRLSISVRTNSVRSAPTPWGGWRGQFATSDLKVRGKEIRT